MYNKKKMNYDSRLVFKDIFTSESVSPEPPDKVCD